MIVYEATKKQFLHDSDNDDIEEVILQRFTAATGKRVATSEISSWKGSLGYMAKVLRDEEVPENTGLAIELHNPGDNGELSIQLSTPVSAAPGSRLLLEREERIIAMGVVQSVSAR